MMTQSNTACLLVFILWSVGLSVYAQSPLDSISIPKKDTTTFELLFSIPQKAVYVTLDKLHNVYIVDDKNILYKYTTQGKVQFEYDDNQYGQISYMDVTNPFQILLYYPDFLQVVVLDRTLSELQSINLSDFEESLIQTNALGMASDNQLWLYNELDFTLNKINILQRSFSIKTDLSQQFYNGITPIKLIERNNTVWLNDPKQGIFQFDAFGQLISQFDLIGVQEFNIFHNTLFYQQGNQFFQFDLAALTTTAIQLPQTIKASEQILVQKNRLVIWKEDRICVYRF